MGWESGEIVWSFSALGSRENGRARWGLCIDGLDGWFGSETYPESSRRCALCIECSLLSSAGVGRRRLRLRRRLLGCRLG
jgi:hypothetical protein